MIIVSDTSPISNLILIKRLDILEKLFTEIIIPSAVDAEVQALSSFSVDLNDYRTAGWIRAVKPANLSKIQMLRANLDEGEAQAIALALELNCGLLLMDERIGTNIARSEGLQTIGLVGVLIKAKDQKIVSEVGAILKNLRDVAGFWLGEKLEKKILVEIGEI